MRMRDAEAEATFMGLRWADGVVCVHCECPTVYQTITLKTRLAVL